MEISAAVARVILVATLIAIADAKLNVVPTMNVTSVKKTELACTFGYDCSCQDCTNKGYGYYCPSSSECYSTEVTCGGGCDGACEETGKGCTSCQGGENCNCVECLTSGYDYFCPSDRECYHSHATCGTWCSDTCVQTGLSSTCQIPITCTQTQQNECTSAQTCCVSGTAPYQSVCADAVDAVCCHVGNMYCFKDSSCDPAANSCLAPSPTPSTECKFCREVVSKLEDTGSQNGCKIACDMLPAGADELCNLAMKYGLCSWIEHKLAGDLGSNQICDMLGACSSGECACGYCTPDYFGQWCLSVPNHCPSSSIGSNTKHSTTTVSERKKSRDAFHAKVAMPPKLSAKQYDRHTWAKELKWKLPVAVLQNLTEHHIIDAQPRNVESFCADGTCDAGNEGCCLTCAP